MPQEMAATWSRNTSVLIMLRVFIHCRQSCSATQPPVIEAVRVPPSAWITSQSMVIWRSPSATRSTTVRSDRPIRRWISTGAAALLAGGRLAPRALGGCARQHAVFGGDPAATLPLEPGRQPVLQRRRHQHMGVAELHEAGAFGIFDHAALEGDGAHFIGCPAAWPHREILLSYLRFVFGGFRRQRRGRQARIRRSAIAGRKRFCSTT